MGYGPSIGFGGFGHFIGAAVGGLLGYFLFLVGVALIFLLVRFLLAATKAAHIYIAKNSPPAVAGPATAAAPTTALSTVAPTTAAPPTAKATKPVTRPRKTEPPTV